jgi:fatty acyl-CoA reductase
MLISDVSSRSLLGEWPNTYTFTKAMAEDLVRDKGVGLPIGVFRLAAGKNICL